MIIRLTYLGVMSVVLVLLVFGLQLLMANLPDILYWLSTPLVRFMP